jgi:predicted glycosyltransferase
MRAQRFAERGWVSQLDPDELTPERLAAAVIESLSAERSAQAAPGPDLGGLTRAAEYLHAAALAARAAVTTRQWTAGVQLIGKAL